MATEKPRFTITVDEELLKQIDDYRFENRFANRTQAVIDLIEKGLRHEESQDELNSTNSKI